MLTLIIQMMKRMIYKPISFTPVALCLILLTSIIFLQSEVIFYIFPEHLLNAMNTIMTHESPLSLSNDFGLLKGYIHSDDTYIQKLAILSGSYAIVRYKRFVRWLRLLNLFYGARGERRKFVFGKGPMFWWRDLVRENPLVRRYRDPVSYPEGHKYGVTPYFYQYMSNPSWKMWAIKRYLFYILAFQKKSFRELYDFYKIEWRIYWKELLWDRYEEEFLTYFRKKVVKTSVYPIYMKGSQYSRIMTRQVNASLYTVRKKFAKVLFERFFKDRMPPYRFYTEKLTRQIPLDMWYFGSTYYMRKILKTRRRKTKALKTLRRLRFRMSRIDRRYISKKTRKFTSRGEFVWQTMRDYIYIKRGAYHQYERTHADGAPSKGIYPPMRYKYSYSYPNTKILDNTYRIDYRDPDYLYVFFDSAFNNYTAVPVQRIKKHRRYSKFYNELSLWGEYIPQRYEIAMDNIYWSPAIYKDKILKKYFTPRMLWYYRPFPSYFEERDVYDGKTRENFWLESQGRYGFRRKDYIYHNYEVPNTFKKYYYDYKTGLRNYGFDFPWFFKRVNILGILFHNSFKLNNFHFFKNNIPDFPKNFEYYRKNYTANNAQTIMDSGISLYNIFAFFFKLLFYWLFFVFILIKTMFSMFVKVIAFFVSLVIKAADRIIKTDDLSFIYSFFEARVLKFLSVFSNIRLFLNKIKLSVTTIFAKLFKKFFSSIRFFSSSTSELSNTNRIILYIKMRILYIKRTNFFFNKIINFKNWIKSLFKFKKKKKIIYHNVNGSRLYILTKKIFIIFSRFKRGFKSLLQNIYRNSFGRLFYLIKNIFRTLYNIIFLNIVPIFPIALRISVNHTMFTLLHYARTKSERFRRHKILIFRNIYLHFKHFRILDYHNWRYFWSGLHINTHNRFVNFKSADGLYYDTIKFIRFWAFFARIVFVKGSMLFFIMFIVYNMYNLENLDEDERMEFFSMALVFFLFVFVFFPIVGFYFDSILYGTETITTTGTAFVQR